MQQYCIFCIAGFLYRKFDLDGIFKTVRSTCPKIEDQP